MTLTGSNSGVGKAASRLEGVDPPIPMIILERGLIVRWMSRTAIAEFGQNAQTILGRSWYELFPQSLARRDEHEALFRGERDQLDLSRIELNLGCERPRYYSFYVRPIRAPDGAVEAVLGVGVDVTAVIEAEQALRASEARLETALWGSKAAFWTISVLDDRAQMSPNFFCLTGIEPAQWHVDRHPWNSRMHPEDLPRVRRTYEDYVGERIDFYECEYRLNTPGGWMWMHDRGRVTARDAHGRPLVIAGTSQDASARKGLENAIEKAAVIERQRISYDLHDGLGQQLTGIQLLLGSIAKRLRADRPAEAHELETVAAHVSQAIDTTRTIAKGLVPSRLRNGDLRLAIEDLAGDVTRRFGMRVRCATEGWTPRGTSELAAQHLYRITQEALSNAHRHGHASEVIVGLRSSPADFELQIIDNGCGIPDRLPESQGIGLVIMAQRARSIGAKLTVGRDPGGGTRVTVHCRFETGFAGP